MIKTILVPTSGSGSDRTVFATALALGRTCAAQLHFLHVHLAPATAALQVPQIEFCPGPMVYDAFDLLRQQGERLSAALTVISKSFARSTRWKSATARARPRWLPRASARSLTNQ